MRYVVNVGHDISENIYYVLSSDIPGLNVEAPTYEELVNITRDVAPDLVGDQAVDLKISFQHLIEFVA